MTLSISSLSDKRLRKVLKSYAVSMMARALGLLVALLTTPWLLDYLGKSGFGLWSVFVQFFTFAAFSDFGVSNGLHNTLLKTRHEKEWHYNLNLIQNTILLMAVIALLMALVFTGPIFLVHWDQVFEVTSDTYSYNLTLALLMVCLLFYLNLPLTVIQKVQFAYMEHHRVYAWEILSKTMTICLVFIGIHMQVEFHWLLVAFFSPLILPVIRISA
ncbi:MAG: hypothetical protein MI867_06745, partial [Pseudomonadales bacterium]|nr:hypothetical protein [Pseudomonadales bacterium]